MRAARSCFLLAPRRVGVPLEPEYPPRSVASVDRCAVIRASGDCGALGAMIDSDLAGSDAVDQVSAIVPGRRLSLHERDLGLFAGHLGIAQRPRVLELIP
jgi:hypothetical protein